MASDRRADLVLMILAVESLGRSRAFYHAAFGWSVTVDVPVYVQMRTSAPGLEVALYQREAFAANTVQLPAVAPPGGITATELYVMVDDLEGTLERAEKAGGRRLSDPMMRSWGDLAAYVADPDGNVVAIATSAPEE